MMRTSVFCVILWLLSSHSLHSAIMEKNFQIWKSAIWFTYEEVYRNPHNSIHSYISDGMSVQRVREYFVSTRHAQAVELIDLMIMRGRTAPITTVDQLVHHDQSGRWGIVFSQK